MSGAGVESTVEDSLAPFCNEVAAYRFVERCVWPAGPVCPHCGSSGRIRPLHGSSTRMGAYKCYACRKPFTVKVGTMFEASNLPMHKWLQAIFLASRDGPPASAGELHRTLDVTPRTALFVLRRVHRQASARLQRHLTHVVAASSNTPNQPKRSIARTSSGQG